MAFVRLAHTFWIKDASDLLLVLRVQGCNGELHLELVCDCLTLVEFGQLLNMLLHLFVFDVQNSQGVPKYISLVGRYVLVKWNHLRLEPFFWFLETDQLDGIRDIVELEGGVPFPRFQ